MTNFFAIASFASLITLVTLTYLYYLSLPPTVAIDFDSSGMPVEVGPKSELLFSIGVLIGVTFGVTLLITVISLKRHIIVERYPYLINLPAFSLLLGRLPEDVRREYVDRIFLVVSLTPFLLIWTIYYPITYFILESARTGFFPYGPHMLTLVFTWIAVFVAAYFLYYRKLYREIKTMIAT
ncbi:MAG: hypothetical protein NZ920_00345 [Aigarchaeota archaeon]|nr:hypothetical protein [Aigarchaeota archaeon]MDW8092742.1 hypothetical protein [Nitrososphaerota archaeon]